MKGLGSFISWAPVVVLAMACSKGRELSVDAKGDRPGSDTTAAATAAGPTSDCAHAVCAKSYFVDAATDDCRAGSPCRVTLKLVATGDFHINDEYPYRFRADDAAGVEFLGADPVDRNSFSKVAGDWQKSEEKIGAMDVKFVLTDRGPKKVTGNFKLSVCSPQACLLEQRQVTAAVAAR